MGDLRTLRKAARDLSVFVVTAGLLAVVENIGNVGLPDEVVPFAAAGAMMIYRYWRDHTGVGSRVDPQ